MFKAMYKTVLSCVRWNGTLSEMFECPSGLRQGCLCSPLAFALLIGKVADFVRRNGKYGFQLIPGGPEICQLLFADDIISISSTPLSFFLQVVVVTPLLEELSPQWCCTCACIHPEVKINVQMFKSDD